MWRQGFAPLSKSTPRIFKSNVFKKKERRAEWLEAGRLRGVVFSPVILCHRDDGDTRVENDLLKKRKKKEKVVNLFQSVKESIADFALPLRPLLDFSAAAEASAAITARLPHTLWLCRNGAVTSSPQSPLRSDTSILSRRQKPINNVNDGSDLFGCPRKQQQWAIMHINCALLGWSHYHSY